jgi:lysozyme
MKLSHRGLELIQEFEGFQGKAYLCPAGVPTIGYGTTKGVTHADVERGRTITRAQALKLLLQDLQEYENGVYAALLPRPPNQNQFDACVSMAFNVGVSGFRSSSVARAHNQGDFQAAARAFALWNKATIGGKKVTLAGLTRRRAAEAALYLELPPGQAPAPMPQAVAPERALTDSHIVRGAAAAGGTAALAGVTEAVNVVGRAKDDLSAVANGATEIAGQLANPPGLNDLLVPVLLVAVVGLCGYIIWERIKQRSRGWA